MNRKSYYPPVENTQLEFQLYPGFEQITDSIPAGIPAGFTAGSTLMKKTCRNSNRNFYRIS